MYSHQVYNSHGGLVPKTKLDGYSYEQTLSCYVQDVIFLHSKIILLIENAVVKYIVYKVMSRSTVGPA